MVAVDADEPPPTVRLACEHGEALLKAVGAFRGLDGSGPCIRGAPAATARASAVLDSTVWTELLHGMTSRKGTVS